LRSPARSASRRRSERAPAARPRRGIPPALSHALPAALVAIALNSCGKTPEASAFDGKRAYDWVQRQVAFGPRAPGTAAHDSCFAMLVAALRQNADVVETDSFSYESPELGKKVRLMNALARFRPKETRRILIAAHWDTRPWADRDPDSTRRSQPILGANDGGSGVGILMELAERMKRHAPGIGVDLALFDGEDLGTETNPSGFFRGSKRYLEWRASEPAPLFVIVVDMVGRKDAAFYWEGNSYNRASNIVLLVWDRARNLGLRQFRNGVKFTIADDHLPFLEADIPAIDVIQFDFPEWHTHKDDLSIIDPSTLEAVGRVLLNLVTEADFLAN
jgi:glutaminyl-peptide cyclotransferase